MTDLDVVFNFLSYMNLTYLINRGLAAFIDQTGIRGILVTPPNAWASQNWHDHPVFIRSGDFYHM